MMKKIVIHAGIQKTATSSIQQTLYSNRVLLEAGGILVPYEFNDGIPNHSYGIQYIFSETPEDFFVFIREGISKEQINNRKKIKRQKLVEELRLTQAEHIIISAESISLMSYVELQNIKRFFENFEWDVEFFIVFAVRSLKSFSSTMHQQSIKDGSGYNIFEDKSIYSSKIIPCIDVFGRDCVHIYKHEDAIKSVTGPVRYFFDFIDIEEEIIEKIEVFTVNESLSNKGFDLISYINNTEPYILDGKLNALRNTYDLVAYYKISGPKYQMELDDLKRVIENNREDIKWLNNLLDTPYSDMEINISRLLVPICDEFDEQYHTEILECLPSVSEQIILLTYKYFEHIMASTNEKEKIVVSKIMDFMEQKYSRIIFATLSEIQISVVERKKIVERSYDYFLSIQDQKSVNDIVEFCVNMSLICEKSNQLIAAKYYLECSSLYKSYSPYVQKKLLFLDSTLDNKRMNLDYENDFSNKLMFSKGIGGLMIEDNEKLIISGERYLPDVMKDHQIKIEHLQRYQSIKDIVKGKKVVDIACGDGYGSAQLAEVALEVQGLDIDEHVISKAKVKYKMDNLSFSVADVTEIHIETGCVDVVVSFETIEHVDNAKQEEFIKEVKRILKPDGILIVSTPNREVYSEILNSDSTFHIHEFTTEEFRKFLENYFDNIDFYIQKQELSTVLLHNNSTELSIMPIISDDEDYNAKFIVAICSNSPIDVTITDSIVFDNGNTFVNNYELNEKLVRIIASKDDYITKLYNEVKNKEDGISVLNDEYQKLNHEMAILNKNNVITHAKLQESEKRIANFHNKLVELEQIRKKEYNRRVNSEVKKQELYQQLLELEDTRAKEYLQLVASEQAKSDLYQQLVEVKKENKKHYEISMRLEKEKAEMYQQIVGYESQKSDH